MYILEHNPPLCFINWVFHCQIYCRIHYSKSGDIKSHLTQGYLTLLSRNGIFISVVRNVNQKSNCQRLCLDKLPYVHYGLEGICIC